LGALGLLVTGLIVLIFISAALAPLESLRWWAGWYAPDEDAPGVPPADVDATSEPANHFLVYLSGIGAIAGDSVPQEEMPFIQGLVDRLPNTRVVANVFPYAVANVGLNGQRAFSNLWGWIERRRLKNPLEISALIVNLRNAFQVAVSADQRYGPVFNLAVANEIRSKLLANGYVPGSGTPITIVGWSGGAQIAVGSCSFLAPLLHAPLYVVSVGGLLSDDPGLTKLSHLWHLYGTKDVVSPVGKYAYTGRWKVYPQSGWNQAVANGTITFTELGPFTHNATGNYFDPESKLPSGQSHLDHTLSVVEQVVREAGLEKPSEPQPAARPAPAT
jgi:hypothetical protein